MSLLGSDMFMSDNQPASVNVALFSDHIQPTLSLAVETAGNVGKNAGMGWSGRYGMVVW